MTSVRGLDERAPAPLPTGTVTFLFTDVEGSTQRWEAHRVEMEQAIARHDELLRNAVSASGGAVFKTVGDAVCAAFARPQDALSAAIAAQTALQSEDFSATGNLPVRMAIHTGTAQERDGDYFGPTVNRIARLLGIGHGGQILVSGATAELLQGVMPAHTSLRDLGEHRLRDLARSEHVYQLAARGLTEIFPALRSLETLPNNLPRQPTAFIGRDQELAEIKSLVFKSQIVTIVGTGGVGKTRAALQVGADLLDGSGDGVWFVDLAQVKSEESVVNSIAAVFDIQMEPDQKPLDELRPFLKNKHLLLILDNCEHVVAETSRIVASLARDCPRVVMLTTSREQLNVHGEQVYRMPSLSVPASGHLSAQQALGYGAVALFVARATALDTKFSFNDEKAPIVADICRRLDGIALAIELAAARVTILNLKQLSQRLDERFRLLTGGDRTALPRQQTMRAAIDWSYELLSDEERMVFRRLAIFQGGWSLEAASQICSDDSLDEFKILDTLSSLANKSLVVVDFSADSQRYRLLESLRQYGVELLHSQGEFDRLAAKHARFFANYVRDAADQWNVIPDVAWVAIINAELDNVRAALHWSLEQGNDPALGAETAERLWVYWFGHQHREGRRWLEAARATVTPESNPRLSVALDLALSRLLLSHSWEAALNAVEKSVEGARALGDQRMLARAIFYLGEAHVIAGNVERAEAPLIEARDLSRSVDDRYRETAASQMLARLYTDRKQFDLARQYFAEAHRYYNTRGPERNRALALIDEALLERAVGNLDRAHALAREALTMAEAVDDRTLQVIAGSALAAHLVLDRRFEDASKTLCATLALVLEDPTDFNVSASMRPAIPIAIHDGNLDLAAKLLGYIHATRRRPAPRGIYRAMFSDEQLKEPLLNKLGEERLVSLMADGDSWSAEETADTALKAFSR